jgi:hypothetical protein
MQCFQNALAYFSYGHKLCAVNVIEIEHSCQFYIKNLAILTLNQNKLERSALQGHAFTLEHNKDSTWVGSILKKH